MSTSANPCFFRCRTIGRAASPPTWACYEQIPYDDEFSDSCSDSCSEDDEDYTGVHKRDEPFSDSEAKDSLVSRGSKTDDEAQDFNMDIEEEGDDEARRKVIETQKDVKGKQRALDQEPEKGPRQRKKRSSVYTLRPILTIQRSQGFVWNQVCRWPFSSTNYN